MAHGCGCRRPGCPECGIPALVSMAEGAQRKFHEHLGACWQCREHPFALCTVGAAVLREAIDG